MAIQFPKGKYLAVVKVGEKGQIVIPKEARTMFGICPGDSLLLLADAAQGIALVSVEAQASFDALLEQVKGGDSHDGTAR